MKKLIQLLLVSCVLIWSTGVFADAPGHSSAQSPESMITCGSGNQEHPVVVADISVSVYSNPKMSLKGGSESTGK